MQKLIIIKMKKFILKGKQLLSKKLQQFDIQAPQIDYVADQTPHRLKQSLNILREDEIDLQDSHQYQTYFKNYPNHHISHYLLDKLRSNPNQKMNSKPTSKLATEPNNNSYSYSPPQNTNLYVPPFDTALQQKALAFKQAVQEYDEGYNKVEHPLLCICVIHFHHKRGTQIQYKYPQDKSINQISDKIVHHAMPDSSHLRNQDCNFFNFQSDCMGKKRMMFGVSYFKQIKVTDKMKQKNIQLTRSHVQKAVAVISTLPLFQYLKLRLQNTTQIFFQNFTNFQIIKQAFNNINHNLLQAWPNIQLPDLYMGCNLNQIVSNLGVANLYEVWKALLYQKRIVIFAQTSSDASSFILSLLSLFPGLSAFGVCSKPISRYLQSLREYALPLRIFSSENFLSTSFHVQDFHMLAKFMKNDQGNFLLGTTNRLLKQSNQYGIQMLVNLQQGTVVKNKSRRPWQALTKKQKNFINQLKQTIQKQQNYDNPAVQDTIRNSFHDFLKSALVTMISGIKQYQKFIVQCAKYEKLLKIYDKSLKQGQNAKKSQYSLMEDEQQFDSNSKKNIEQPQDYAPTFPQSTNQIILPQLLLNKSFAYFRQFHNSNLPQIIAGKMIPSIYINNYQYLYRINEEEFVLYNWLEKKLAFGKGNLVNFDGKEIRYRMSPSLEVLKQDKKDNVRSIYIGLIQNTRYAKHGFYVDKTDYYQGEFTNGFKHGYGKYNNQNEKYIGNFQNNLYDGEGQLVKDGNVYAGSFKQGLKHGFGSIQGNQSYSGEWRFDKPFIKQTDGLDEIEDKRKNSEGRKNSNDGKKQGQKRKSSASQTKKG